MCGSTEDETVVTPTGGRSRSFRNSQRGPPWIGQGRGRAGDYRKWPCICRNYRNNGNKTKPHQRAPFWGDHLLSNCRWLIRNLRFSKSPSIIKLYNTIFCHWTIEIIIKILFRDKSNMSNKNH